MEASIMITLKKKAIFVFSAILFAYALYEVTLTIYFTFANQDVFVATIWNFGLIVFFIIIEKIEYFFYHKYKRNHEGKDVRLIDRIFLGIWGGASFKSAMYLFYIVVIIYSALLAANPEMSIRLFPEGYLPTVRYGILFLVALDKFTEQLFKDIKMQGK